MLTKWLRIWKSSRGHSGFHATSDQDNLESSMWKLQARHKTAQFYENWKTDSYKLRKVYNVQVSDSLFPWEKPSFFCPLCCDSPWAMLTLVRAACTRLPHWATGLSQWTVSSTGTDTWSTNIILLQAPGSHWSQNILPRQCLGRREGETAKGKTETKMDLQLTTDTTHRTCLLGACDVSHTTSSWACNRKHKSQWGE